MNSYKSFDSDTANATEQCIVKATEQSYNDVTKQSGNALSLFVNDDVGCKVDHIPHTRKCLSRKNKKSKSRGVYESYNMDGFTTNRCTNVCSPNEESTVIEVGLLLSFYSIPCKLSKNSGLQAISSWACSCSLGKVAGLGTLRQPRHPG